MTRSHRWPPQAGAVVRVESPRSRRPWLGKFVNIAIDERGSEVVRVKPMERGEGWSDRPVEVLAGYVTVIT